MQMFFSRLALLLLGLMLSNFSFSQDLITLFDAASRFDANYQSVQAAAKASASRVEQAKAGLLPSVGLNGSLNRTHTHIERASVSNDLGSTAQNLGVNATHPLYRQTNQIAFNQADLQLEIAQIQLDAAMHDLMIRLSQAYFDVLAAKDSLEFIQAQKTAVQEQRAAAQRNFEVGTTTITDEREAQARLDLVNAQEIAAQNDWLIKRLALMQLVGLDDVQPSPLLVTSLPELETKEINEWIHNAQTYQPQLRQANLALDVARLEIDKAKANHLPTLDLVAGYNISKNPTGTTALPGASLQTNSASIGINLNMPIFSGFGIQNRVKETLALEEKASADLEAARRQVTQATRAAFYGLQSTKAQVKAFEAAEKSSQSALEANQLGYQVGVRINIDVLNAQTQLYQTKRDLAQARYNALMTDLKLRQASGMLKIDDLQKINQLIKPINN